MSKAHPGAELVPAKYGDPLPAEELYAGKQVFIVDFSYPPDQMRVIAAKAAFVMMLDHHASAIRQWDDEPVELSGGFLMISRWGKNVEFLFDVDRSGAMLTWIWLSRTIMFRQPDGFFWRRYEGGVTQCPCPWLVQYVHDRDLWQWKLDDSKEVNAYLRTLPQTLEAWSDLHDRTEPGDRLWFGLVESGRAILRREQQVVDAAVKRAVIVPFAGHPAIPVANVTECISEVGHALCQGHPFSATYFDDHQRGLRIWSLRSDGAVDVSKVAMQFPGGGGHKAAAGFQTALGDIIPSHS